MDKYLRIVNQDNPFCGCDFDDFEYVDTIDRKGNPTYMEKETFEAFNQLKEYLKSIDIDISINSAGRSMLDQMELERELAAKHGEEWIQSHVAPVGASEHHTGLCVDVHLDKLSYGNNMRKLVINLPKIGSLYLNGLYKKLTPDVLAKFGFIIRYPEGTKDITGYDTERWHFRYIGKENALDMLRLKKEASLAVNHNREITLEEYVEFKDRLRFNEDYYEQTKD